MICKVLFVDDDPSLLRSLKRILIDLRDSWEMHFVGSGVEALELLETVSFDVIVADLKMPGMDGVELLEQVRERWPHVVRIILSGYSNKSRVLSSTKVAHQFLCKPSSPEEIRSVVERMISLNDLRLYDSVRAAVAGLESLPVLGSTYDELLRIAESATASASEVAGLITRDVGLTASVLKLVNTAFFGLPRHIDDPTQAVSLLGMETIKALVLMESFVTRFDDTRYPDFTLEYLWTHSVTTAQYAKTIARLEGWDTRTQERAYVGGLLHDIGKLVLAEALEKDYRSVISVTRERNVSALDAEREIIKVTHAEIGAYLLGLWGFAEEVVHGTACHHAPNAATSNDLVVALHAANALEHELVVLNTGYAPHPVDTDFLEAVGLAGRYEVWKEACRDSGGGK